MRKPFLFILFILLIQTSYAQLQLGLKFSPQISSGRTMLKDSQINFEPADPAFKFSLGLIMDIGFAENYFCSTGLNFMPKYVGFKVSNEDGSTLPIGANTFEEYKIQYLQLPITLKLFTNEIQPDLKIFFQVGVGPEVKVYDEALSEDYNLVNEFQFIDVSAILAFGMEYKLGLNTILIGGFSFQRDLINQLNKLNNSFITFQEKPSYRNTIISLDLGVKF